MEVNSTYKPLPKQIEAHTCSARFILYGGAMGGGKTRFLCEDNLASLIRHPGNFTLMARQSGVALRQTTMEVFFSETLPPGSDLWKALGARYNRTDNELSLDALSPPSKCWFTGLDHDNIERIKSLNLGGAYVDEVSEVAESTINMLGTRLRRKPNGKDIVRRLVCTSNPEAGWVKRKWVDSKLQDYAFIQATWRDNPYLPDDYEELFRSYPERWRQKYLYGNWEAASGLIYPEFREKFHVIPSISKKELEGFFREGWRHMRGFDHGQQNPAACIGFLIGRAEESRYAKRILGKKINERDPEFDDYRTIIAYREYYSPGLIPEHRKRIHLLWADVPRPGITWADPSIWRRDRDRQIVVKPGRVEDVEASIYDEYQLKPYPFKGLHRGNRSVNAGILRVATLLSVGHYFITEDCEKLIEEKLQWSWKEASNEDLNFPEVPIDKDDHTQDAERYALMSMPPPKAKVEEEKKNEFLEKRKLAQQFKKGPRIFQKLPERLSAGM